MRKKCAILVAAGEGLRMQEAVPKQFLLLLKKPILYYTIKAFLEAYEDMHIILVLPQNTDKAISSSVLNYFSKERITTTTGGATRFDSVKNGLKKADSDSVIFVHDGVRPMVTTELIRACYNQTIEQGSAVPALPLKDSIRKVEGPTCKAMNRTDFCTIQTPQTFLSEILMPAFEQPYQKQFTDEATVVEYSGKQVHLIEGEEENIKITRPVDLLLAGQILFKRSKV